MDSEAKLLISQLISALEVFIPSPMCRDCADELGTCPHDNNRPCDPDEAEEWAREIRNRASKYIRKDS